MMSDKKVDNITRAYNYETNTPRPGETPDQIAVRAAPRDSVNHPPHYKSASGMEVIDVIEGFSLGFHEGNVVKYLLRWRQKGGIEDLKKARWYLDRFIESQSATTETRR